MPVYVFFLLSLFVINWGHIVSEHNCFRWPNNETDINRSKRWVSTTIWCKLGPPNHSPHFSFLLANHRPIFFPALFARGRQTSHRRLRASTQSQLPVCQMEGKEKQDGGSSQRLQVYNALDVGVILLWKRERLKGVVAIWNFDSLHQFMNERKVFSLTSRHR